MLVILFLVIFLVFFVSKLIKILHCGRQQRKRLLNDRKALFKLKEDPMAKMARKYIFK